MKRLPSHPERHSPKPVMLRHGAALSGLSALLLGAVVAVWSPPGQSLAENHRDSLIVPVAHSFAHGTGLKTDCPGQTRESYQGPLRPRV